VAGPEPEGAVVLVLGVEVAAEGAWRPAHLQADVAPGQAYPRARLHPRQARVPVSGIRAHSHHHHQQEEEQQGHGAVHGKKKWGSGV